MRVEPHHVYDAVAYHFGISDEYMNPVHQNSHVSKPYVGCWMYTLRHGLGWRNKLIMAEVGYGAPSSVDYLIRNIADGVYDTKYPFDDRTAVEHCNQIIANLATKYDGVITPAPRHGHTPFD